MRSLILMVSFCLAQVCFTMEQVADDNIKNVNSLKEIVLKHVAHQVSASGDAERALQLLYDTNLPQELREEIAPALARYEPTIAWKLIPSVEEKFESVRCLFVHGNLYGYPALHQNPINKIIVFNLYTDERIGSLKKFPLLQSGHAKPLMCINGNLIAAYFWDQQCVKIWNLEDCSQIFKQKLDNNMPKIKSLAVDDEGCHIFLGCESGLYVIDVASGAIQCFKTGPTNMISPSPSNHIFCIANDHQCSVIAYNAETQTLVRIFSLETSNRKYIRSALLTADEKQLIIIKRSYSYNDGPGYTGSAILPLGSKLPPQWSKMLVVDLNSKNVIHKRNIISCHSCQMAIHNDLLLLPEGVELKRTSLFGREHRWNSLKKLSLIDTNTWDTIDGFSCNEKIEWAEYGFPRDDNIQHFALSQDNSCIFFCRHYYFRDPDPDYQNQLAGKKILLNFPEYLKKISDGQSDSSSSGDDNDSQSTKKINEKNESTCALS